MGELKALVLGHGRTAAGLGFLLELSSCMGCNEDYVADDPWVA